MPWGDWINDLPMEFFMVVHIAAFAIGIFDLCRFASYVQAYFRTVLDRPGLTTSVDKQIGVLWDEASGDVWVDTNQDRSFAAVTLTVERPEAEFVPQPSSRPRV